MKSLYYSIKNGIRNIIKWFPVIWNDRDWDWTFILKILHHKLNNMESSFRSEYAMHANNEKHAHNIMIAKKLCKRLIENEYLSNATLQHDKKFEEVDFKDLFIKDSGIKNMSRYVGDSDKERAKSFDKCCKHSDYMKNQDLDYLFTHLRKYIECWWD